MTEDELSYLTARVAALEALVAALLAAGTDNATANASTTLEHLAMQSLAREGYDNQLLGDGVRFNDAARDFITRLAASGRELAVKD